MGIDLRVNTVNQIARGVTIYSEGEPVESVCLVLKGRVLVEKRGVRLVIGSGNFLGVSDLEEGVYGVSYTAFDNASISIVVIFILPTHPIRLALLKMWSWYAHSSCGKSTEY